MIFKDREGDQAELKAQRAVLKEKQAERRAIITAIEAIRGAKKAKLEQARAFKETLGRYFFFVGFVVVWKGTGGGGVFGVNEAGAHLM